MIIYLTFANFALQAVSCSSYFTLALPQELPKQPHVCGWKKLY